MKKRAKPTRQARVAPRDPLLPRSRRARRRIAYFGATSIVGFIALIAIAFGGSALHQKSLGSPQVAAVVSAVLVDLANSDRTSQGISTLTVNPQLVAVAQAKANDMATKGYFAHTSPEGLDPWHWFKLEGYAFDYAGENLAVDFADSGDVERAWMNSPTHRQNLLDPHYTEVGIATAQGMYQGRVTTFVVQAFGTPAGHTAKAQTIAAATVPETPTEVATAAAKPAVLGTSATQKPSTPKRTAPAPVPKPDTEPAITTPSITVATTDPLTAGALVQRAVDAPPFWRFLVAYPRATLQYSYYLIGILILLAVGFETGLELRWHHRQHALRAGALLAVMGLLFFAADAIFFAKPVLALVAG